MDYLQRCINLDWLEVYALEDTIGYPHNADYFLRQGFYVKEREYGTRVYNEMFTIYGTDDLPLYEIRRSPKSVAGYQAGGVMDRYSCHIRLCNRTCYMEDAAGMLQLFCERYGFAVQRISRLDICLDFEKFDSGDNPQSFVQRYVAGRYAKINQAKIAVHGLDRWDGRCWNSVKWGQPTSMVSTKLYNKTMELREVHDKPYIRQSWRAAGLITDWHTMTKVDKDGNEYTPDIWRLEFSVMSSTKNWFVVEDPYSTKRKLRSIRHTLDMYRTRRQMYDVFVSLCAHYFHFKYVEYKGSKPTVTQHSLAAIATDYGHSLAKPLLAARERQRKDRCKDKVLFRYDAPVTFYKVTHVATSATKDRADLALLHRLEYLRNTTLNKQLHDAADVIIEILRQRLTRDDYAQPFNDDEVQLLRRLVSWRCKHHDTPLADDVEFYKSLLALEDEIWAGNTAERGEK